MEILGDGHCFFRCVREHRGTILSGQSIESIRERLAKAIEHAIHPNNPKHTANLMHMDGASIEIGGIYKHLEALRGTAWATGLEISQITGITDAPVHIWIPGQQLPTTILPPQEGEMGKALEVIWENTHRKGELNHFTLVRRERERKGVTNPTYEREKGYKKKGVDRRKETTHRVGGRSREGNMHHNRKGRKGKGREWMKKWPRSYWNT